MQKLLHCIMGVWGIMPQKEKKRKEKKKEFSANMLI